MKRPGEETLIRYFRGECSPGERKTVQAYLAMNIDQEYIAGCLQEAFGDFGHEYDPNVDRPELDRLWTKFTHLQQQPAIVPIRSRNRWYAYAAAVVLLVFGGMFFLFLNNDKQKHASPEIAWHQTSAGTGQPRIVKLPDSSMVTLFPGSAIEMPESFNQTDRHIKLTGRAFFQVSHNSQKPFYVTADGLTTKVLGTSFEVNTLMTGAESIVTLHTGKISIAHAGQEIARLIPDQQIRFQQTTGQFRVTEVQAAAGIAWMHSELDYDQATLKTILYELGNWYGVKISTPNPQLLRKKITISFKELPIDKALTLLSKSAGFSYSIRDHQIIIKERRRMDSGK